MQQDFAWHLLVSLVTQAPGKTPGLISKPKDDDEIEACGQDSFFFFWVFFVKIYFWNAHLEDLLFSRWIMLAA